MNTIFRKLAASRLDDDPDPPRERDIRDILNIELPTTLLSLLHEIGGAVFFDNGALFKPLERCGAEDRKGYGSISLLYSLGTNTYGLEERNHPRDEFPVSLVAIGETPGGDLICLDRETMEVVRWDHEADEEDSVTLIARDFDSFIASLKTEAEVESVERSPDRAQVGTAMNPPFPISDDTLVASSAAVLDRGATIIYVAREDKGEAGELWQFHGPEDDEDDFEEIRMAPLKCILKLDPSVAEMAGLPLNTCAMRDHPGDEWTTGDHDPNEPDLTMSRAEFRTSMLHALQEQGWIVRFTEAGGSIPGPVRERYPWVKPSIWTFLSKVSEVSAPQGDVWLLTWEDYTGTSESCYAWNVWEEMILEGFEKRPDEAARAETVAFWDEHFPLMLTVQPFGYGYAALRRSDGTVVAGWGPDFETPFGVIADSFDELLELLPEMNPETNLDSLLPDHD